MATVQEIIDEIKAEVRDADDYEITIAQVLAHINSSARDASGQGWLLHLTDDESLTFISAGTAITITSSSVADPTVITTATAHGLDSGDTITIAGHTGSTPDIDGAYIATVLTTTTFSIPIEVTGGGTGGTVIRTASYEYAVPASFAFVKDIFYEDATVDDAFDDIVPRHYWHLRIDVGGSPKILVHQSWTLPADDQKMKIVGFKRPTIYALVTETADVGMEAFLRDRAISHAYGFLATVTPELENIRLALRDRKFSESQLLLERHYQDVRVVPAPRLVPGR